MLKFAAAILACLSASAAATAADLPNGAASPGLLRGDSAYSWSGVYAGASAGAASGGISADAAIATFGQGKARGFVGGVQAGFNKQAGSLVVGLEADFSLSNTRGDNRRTLSGRYNSATVSGVGNMESTIATMGTVRVRVGYAIDNVLLYGTGGYAFAHEKLAMSGAISAVNGSKHFTAADAGSSSNTPSGWAAGVGVEYAFARGISVRAEYLRLQFSSASFLPGTWAETNATFKVHLLRTGLNFRI